ncbi:MAG: small conductance mechanosensitive channel [Marivirga sp.]|jgi:small conductance mechanosensitive channel
MIFTYTEFGGSSINFEIKFWIKFPEDSSYLEMRNRAIKEIKKAFDAACLAIPYPIRTLYFGIKGGKTLSQMAINQSQGQQGSAEN